MQPKRAGSERGNASPCSCKRTAASPPGAREKVTHRKCRQGDEPWYTQLNQAALGIAVFARLAYHARER